MRHTHTFTSLFNTSTLRRTKGSHLLLVATFVLLASVGFATLLYSHTAAFVTPSLGTAQSFGVLGASTVTNTGPTTVSGDLGVWPGTAVTGFPPGTVTNGVIHANDAVALQAQSDVTIAYNSLAGLPCNTNLTGQDLGGLTLAPGVYCFNTSAQLTGALALDAQGDPNAVFVFQIGSTLVTASNASVNVINGAQNCNAFWQVGSSATLGTNTSFIGSILALASITLNTNAILSGRALARTGAVTMDSNAITRTTCAPLLAKSFSPPTIFVNGVSQLTITLSNPNTIVAMLTAPLTDTLPPGVLIAAPPNASNTCGGVATATAGGNTVTLTGGAIPAGNGVMPGTCTITVNVTAGLPGSYLNTLPIGALQTSNGSNITPASATLTAICPPIDTTLTAPVAVCALSTGNTASVPNAGVGATYAWTITNGTITAGQGTPNITFTAGTTSPVTLNVTVTTSPGCSANGSRQVTINPNPSAAAGPPQALCQTVPGPTVFTLNGTAGNGTPQWSVFASTGTAAATIVTPNNATTNVNVTGNGTVTLRLTVTSNTTPSCGTASADVVLTINANPAAAAGVDQTLCQTLPGPTVFNVTGTATNGAPSWSVFATTGTALATIVSPNSATTAVNVTGNGTVTLRLSVMSNATPNCGTATDDVVLTVLPPPLANAGIDQAACQTLPGPTVFNVTGNALNGTPATPAWTLVGTTGTAVPTILTPNNTTTGVNITGTGTVTLRFTVNSNSVPNCGTATDDVVLTVATSPVALAGPDQMLCQTLPGPTVFTVAGTGGTPNWSVLSTTGTASAIIVSPNSATTAVNVTGLGTVTLRLTTSSPACGNATDDVVLTVNPNPTAAAGPDQALCQILPGPTVFNVSGTLTNATPSWSVLATTGTATAIIVSPNNAATAVNVTGLGTVTLRLTGANANCGPATDDVVLTVNANPAAAAGVDQMLCQTVPGPTVFTVTGTASGGTLQWSVLATTGTATATIVSPNAATTAVNVNGLGTVTLRLTTTSANCGVATDDVLLTINANPIAAAGLDQSLCQILPGPTTFTVTGTFTNGTPATPAWTLLTATGTAVATILTPNNTTTGVNITGTGTVTLRFTVNSNATPACAAATDDVVLTVNANPLAAAGVDQTLCQVVPGPTVFTVTGTVTGGTPQWSVLAATGTALANIVTPNNATTNVNVTGNGTVTLRLTVTSNAVPACASATDDVLLTINANPLAAAGVDKMLCQTVPGPTVFNVTGTASGGILLWSVLATTGTATATIVTPNSATTNVNVNGLGTVTLRLTTTSANCGMATDDVLLTVNPNPAAAAGVDQMLCQTLPGPTVFTVTGTATNGTPTWNVLSTTGTAAAIIVSPNSATTAVNVTGAGTVTLRLTSTSANCGAATDDVVLTVLPAPLANAGIDQALCQTIPGPTVFTVVGNPMNGIPATPAWTLVGTTGTAVPIILTPNNTTTGVNITGTGTVTLRFTVNSNSVPNCGTAFDDVVLTVTTNAIALAGPDQALCQTVPGPTVFTVSGTGGTPSWSVIATTGTAVATIVAPNSATTAVNVTGLGTVTLRLTTSSPGCGNTTDDVVLTVNPNPAAAAGPDQMLCQVVPGPTVFTVTGTLANGTPQWSVVGSTGTALATIVTPNNATTNVNVTGNGTVTLRLNVTSNATPSCGTAADDVLLTVNASPTAAAGVDQTLCQTVPGPTVFTVTGTVSSGTPQWSVLGTTGTTVANIVTPNNATTNVNVTGNGTVTLRLTVTSNATPSCGTATSNVVLTVNANPAAAAGPDQTLCQTVPGPTVFNVTGTATNGTPAWSVLSTTGTALAIIVSPNSATTAVNVTGNGTVTLRLTVTSNLTPSCGAATSNVVLTVLPAPLANAGIDQAICQTVPGPTVFTVSGVATNGTPATPAWTLVSTTGTAVPTILTPNNTTTGVNITGLGTVTLRFTVNSNSVPNCGTAFDDVVLTVTAGGVALAGPDQALCQTIPGPTVFTVNGAGGPPSWSVIGMTGTAAAIIVSPNSATTNVNVTGLGTVTLRLTTTSPNCGTATDDIVLTVNASPVAAAGPDQALCQVVPGPTAFTVTGTFTNGTPATPAWTLLTATGTAVVTILTPNNATTGVNITGRGTVTLRFTVNSNAIPACGPATDDVVLTVNANPAAAAGVDQTLCQTAPGPTVFTVTGTVSGGTPQWSVLATTGTASAIIVTPNSATTNVNVVGNGTVTLRLTVTSNATPNCGTATSNVVLTVNANPAAAAGPDQMLCQTVPGPTVFTVTGTVSGGTPQWSVFAVTGTASAIIVSPNSATTVVNVTGTGTITLRLTVTSNATPSCSTALDDVVLTVNPAPVTAITVATPVCGLTTGNTASVPDAGAGATYLWTITNGTITSGQGTRSITYTAGATGPLTLNVTVTTQPGCSASGSAQVTVNSNPIAAAIPPQTLCQTLPGPTVFTLNGTVANGTPQWSVLGSTGTAAATIVTPNSATTVVNVTGSGTVTLRLTVTSNAIPACGTATSDVVLTVNPLPVSTITALATVCALTPGNTASVPDAGAGATYLWTITGGTITAGQGTRSITYTAGNTGNVTLAVTVTTAAGCSANSTKLVTVDSTCGVDVCIVKTASALVAIENSQFTYTLSVVNFGPGAATGVIVTDTFQSGIRLVSATPPPGTTCSGTATLICNLGTLANQATATIRLVVTFPMKSAGSVLCNTATITSDQIEIAPANNTSTVCVPVEKAPPGPGLNLPPTSQVSDQKAGSVLVYPYYTSDATNPNRANTRICLTNVENQWSACVHLFFVDGTSCAVADANICLSPNQTACFLLSDLDPGTSGYLVAVLVDCMTGCPLNINTLIGDEFIKLASGHTANVGAEAIAGLPGAPALCDVNSSTAELKFDGVMYNQLPRVLALDNLASPADGNETVLIVNRIGGNLGTGAATLGALFGLLYNDAESGFSFSFTAGCQFRNALTDNFPRTVPRLTTILPAGRSGWLKLWGASDVGLFGVALNFNPNAATNTGAFNGGHNLHKLTLTPNASITIPIFPPAC